MDRLDIPFNIRLLGLTEGKLKGLRPVRSLDIFEGSTKNFHSEGLFSTEIFGRVGDEQRALRFSYIDIRIGILHPVVFNALSDLKQLYAGIMSGTAYAVWNPDIKDFEKSNAVTGKTGYQFFMDHWKDIQFEETKSDKRQLNIDFVTKSYDKALYSKIVVIPAALRDLEIEDGQMKMDDMNNFYRTFLSVSNTLSDASIKANPESINVARYRLQATFNGLYDYLEAMVRGKKKLILGGWATRAVLNGTRNVITAMDTSVSVLGAPGNPDSNTTIAGLYQSAKAALPVTQYCLANGFLEKVFPSVSAPARLVNRKTLKLEEVQLKPAYYDYYRGNEGLEKLITSFAVADVRHKPLMVDGRYIGLIYKGPDGTFRLMQSIDELPSDRKAEHVSPVTFCELLYIAIYRDNRKTKRGINGLPAYVTRYPITGIGSIYPSKLMVKPTVVVETRRELDENWQLMGEDDVAYQFPIRGANFIETIVPHSSRLQGLSADFDGDTSSLTVMYSDEAIQEVYEHLASKKAYVGPDGNFTASMDVSTIALVFHNLTSPVGA